MIVRHGFLNSRVVWASQGNCLLFGNTLYDLNNKTQYELPQLDAFLVPGTERNCFVMIPTDNTQKAPFQSVTLTEKGLVYEVLSRMDVLRRLGEVLPTLADHLSATHYWNDIIADTGRLLLSPDGKQALIQGYHRRKQVFGPNGESVPGEGFDDFLDRYSAQLVRRGRVMQQPWLPPSEAVTYTTWLGGYRWLLGYNMKEGQIPADNVPQTLTLWDLKSGKVHKAQALPLKPGEERFYIRVEPTTSRTHP
jgi:hypothetical protein